MKNIISMCAISAGLLSITTAIAEPVVKWEVESLVPIYFFGGSHAAIGARVDDWRVRTSCIDGGRYDYEPKNQAVERNLGKGCGVFLGYFFTPNWEVYLFVEKQSYQVTHRTTLETHRFDVIDVGPGVGYQYFIGKDFYVQPALHLYWRPSQSKVIGGSNYSLPNTDISVVARLGYRF
ncbi:MAG: hypothetical protein HOO97_02875 [Sideroxydans sp.]|nr:hypothetical protein [Sideroxydans sp.]NOT98024.1 hypothetical protein [Sideroxydans sp.]